MWAVDPERLPMWVVYDNPKDYPGQVIARLWYSLPAAEPTQIVMIASLQTIAAALSSHGFSNIGRRPWDEPHIVEVWL